MGGIGNAGSAGRKENWMAEYIYRDDAISVIRHLFTPNKSPAQREMLRTAAVGIGRIPAADVVPVIHCQECRYWKRNLENDTYCSCLRGLSDPEEDDFCSYGQRQETALKGGQNG